MKRDSTGKTKQQAVQKKAGEKSKKTPVKTSVKAGVTGFGSM